MPAAKQPQDRLPSSARKSRAETNRQKILDQTLELKIDGESYKLTPADLNGLIERQIRRETGMSVVEIMERLEAHPGVDLLAYFMWAVRLSRGEDVPLDDVLASVSYDTELVVMRDGEPDGPKARAKSSSPTSPG